MAHLQYSFKGKPMEPFDKSPRRNGWVLYLLVGVIAGLLLIIAGLGLWIAWRHLSAAPVAKQAAAEQESDVEKVSTPIELPQAKPSKAVAQAKEQAQTAPTPPPAPRPPPPPKRLNPQEAAKLFDVAGKDFAAEKYVSCRENCWKALECVEENDPLWLKAVDLLGKASIVIFTTDVRSPEKQLYHVKGGDSMLKLALSNNTTMEAIRKANGMAKDESVIHPGQTFCIYKGDWRIKVDKSRYRLYLYDGDRLFKAYTVGIGRQDRTPVGTFEVGVKQPRPDWYSKGKKYEYGSPENILGTRWMALNPTSGTNQDLKGYGIHGTNDPAGVGKSASNGCVRMRNEDVEELFSIAPMKTPVEIVE